MTPEARWLSIEPSSGQGGRTAPVTARAGAADAQEHLAGCRHDVDDASDPRVSPGRSGCPIANGRIRGGKAAHRR